MSRLPLQFDLTEQSAALLDKIKKATGKVPNICQLLAHAPSVLDNIR